MSKAVLISIKPKWCDLIASGRKTIELRKTKPKLDIPFKCYIYCTDGPLLPRHNERVTYGRKMVIGEFVCDGFLSHCEMANADIAEAQSLVKREKILEYAGEKEVFGWHISDLVIYDKPKELGEFIKPCVNELYCEECAMYCELLDRCGNAALVLKKPPQSWCYVEEWVGGTS